MKGLLGLIRPTGGTLVTAEELKRTGIGYLPQQTAAQKDFSPLSSEVVLSGCLNRRGMLPFYSRKEREIADRNMEKLGIGPLRKQCVTGELSGGQQQRVLIARALCATSSPKLIPGREPITGLDPTGYPGVLRHDPETEPGGTKVGPSLMVSHDLRNLQWREANKRSLHLQKRVPVPTGLPTTIVNSQAAGHFYYEEGTGQAASPWPDATRVKLHMHRGGEIMNLIREMLSYPFLVRALAGGMMVSPVRVPALGWPGAQERYKHDWGRFVHRWVLWGPFHCPVPWAGPLLRYPFRWWFWPLFLPLRITENSRLKAMQAIALISSQRPTLGIIVTTPRPRV